ncbi:MAG: metallophosphoesterase [Bacteroidales bacterium]|nr:metallophosphoesterase [Bacteroidales bacterium]
MRKIVLLMLGLCVVCSCAQNPRKGIVILHCNDTHSHFEAEHSLRNLNHGGVIERAAFIDSVRCAEGEDRVLLLHAGDFSQGTSYFTELNGTLEIEMLNALKYDAVALGNHEFDNNIEALTERLRKLENTEVLCANLDLSSFELGKYVKPYAVFVKNGMRVGVIGLEAKLEGVVSATIADRIPQLDNVEVVNKWADHLKGAERCDIVILLSHSGYDEDQKLIPQVRNVDLVIGGHTHTFVDEMIYVDDADGKPVGIVTDGCWGLEMGKVTYCP